MVINGILQLREYGTGKGVLARNRLLLHILLLRSRFFQCVRACVGVLRLRLYLLVGFCQVFACNGIEWAILQNDTGSGGAYCNYLQLRMLVNVGEYWSC